MMSSRAYAEYDIAERDCVVPLPEELDDEPFPAESLACALDIFERSDPLVTPGRHLLLAT